MLTQKLDNLVKLFSPESMKAEVLKIGKGSEKFLTDLIKHRLYNEGVDIDDKQLRTDIAKSQGTSNGYSRNTTTIKRSNAQRTTNVTLRDSGEMYDSFKVDFNKDSYSFTSDNFNIIYENFRDMYNSSDEMQNKIVNLNEEELHIFIWEIIQPSLVRVLKSKI